jgi:malto-oligosyltrehalose synthase/4-alpha-glucanotransferase
MYNPVATYRIQFHKDFNFKEMEQVLEYLKSLGVKTIYASPIFTSTSGSAHGYDGIDPEKINPEIGTQMEFERTVAFLKANGMGWLQDIVPNHMAFDIANKWLWDVLEKGIDSEYASFFDIDWDNDDAGQRLMIPFLSAPVDDLIRKGEIKIDLLNGEKVLLCNNVCYPLNKNSLALIENVELTNESYELLQQILNLQFYRLCQWQETDTRINYRRFFTINGLICLNIQELNVFSRYHSLIKRFINDGLIDGLRVDHIDGLYDPKGYLDRLRQLVGEDKFIVVEKILEPGEELDRSWPIQGATGYEFLAMVNNLFTNRAAKNKFDKFYRSFTGDNTDLQQQIIDKKSYILYNHMQGELNNLLNLFKNSDLIDSHEYNEVSDDELREAIGKFLVLCPVYRYYGDQFPLSKSEEDDVGTLLDEIEEFSPQLSFAVRLLRQALLEKPNTEGQAYRDRVLHFYKRCMQFTGPLMAKGVEDTLMYSYNRFIGHNDVGDSPDAFGYSIEEFHTFMINRQKSWPMALNATSTHDTKRGEDARARLAVLTDIPEEWAKAVKQWSKVNSCRNGKQPDKNDEYFIYQSLISVYPFNGVDADLEERMHAYLEKALREAKRHSNWAFPNNGYEEKAKSFLSKLLNKNNEFYGSFLNFLSDILDHGIINSLSQLILKFTCPGVPDLYQGTELWDLSLVDPDNRNPVDYDLRAVYLDDHQNADLTELWKYRESGSIKLWLTSKLLFERRRSADVFCDGLYLPIEVKGRYRDNIIAFARVYQSRWYITVVPLHTAQICKAQKCAPINIDWVNTSLILPQHASSEWKGLINDIEFDLRGDVKVSELFCKVPFEVLVSVKNKSKRNAGLLVAISSLPSVYGIGDIGPAAYNFVDFLHRSCQTYWQLLPLNPISASSCYSPYSSISAMAGNILLISPELLVEAGLLTVEDITNETLEQSNKAEYKAAEKVKMLLLEKAYECYLSGTFSELKVKHEQFCNIEKYWLDDFALFIVLKLVHDDAPWFEWHDKYKNRNATALDDVSVEYKSEIDKIKWCQFIFSLQWKDLRKYCDIRGIKLFGDMPFYVNHDSADVWSNSEYFSLAGDGKMLGVAGVPPDYFSEDGQLWGMPTFNWDKLKKDNYSWWIKRLRRNLELFELVRLDHFRAFAEYWEVPAGERTAKNGKWLSGPGKEFFEIVRQEIGSLPFVAEDLGDNMEAVYSLRDEIGLPGMKVLQFAFGEHMADSVDIPHNFPENCIVYTGTHDNNTSVSWFDGEAKIEDKKRLQSYAGTKVTESNVHKVLSRLAYASIAQTVILPLQDVIGLGEESRMNTPGSKEGNWLWRFSADQVTPEMERQLREWVKMYNRC